MLSPTLLAKMMTTLDHFSKGRLRVIAPNLWSGIGLVRHGPGTALVGSAKQVLSRIDDYRSAGIEVLIVSGMPLLEEAYRFAELVLPHLPVNRTADGGITSTWTKDRDAAWKSVA
jgi:alkanesulfonate monooxygenase